MSEASASAQSRSSYALAAEALVWVAVIGAPLARGGVDPAVFLVVAILSAAALALTGGARRREGLVVPVAALAIAGGALLALLSALPLPRGLANLLSPRAVALSALTPEAAPSFVPWSLDPPASLVDAVRLAALAALVVTAATLSRRERVARRLASAVAWAGLAVCASSAVALVLGIEHAAGTGPRAAVASPFVNPNHLASFAVLTAAAAAGLARGATEPRARFGWSSAAFASAALGVASLSNGGIAALVVAAFVLVALAARRREAGAGRSRTWRAFGAVVLLVTAAALLVGLESVLDQVQDAEHAAEGKTWPWPATLQLVKAHWLTGVGRGAFSAAFPAFAPPRTLPTVTHPENLPLQWLSEWGVPAAVAGLALLGWTLWQATFRREEAGDAMAAAEDGLLAGCLAVLVHEAADFGLEFMGVGVPFAVALGVVAGRAAGRRRRRSAWAFAGAAAVALVIVLGGFLGLRRLVDDELATAAAASEKNDAAAIDRDFRAIRAHHPADAWVLLRAADALLTHSTRAGSEAEKRDALARALPFLGRAQELVQTDVAHEVTARALWLLGRRAQAITELRLAYANSGRPLNILDEALGMRATPEELAAFPAALAASLDEHPDPRPMFEPTRASVALLRFLLLERHRPKLARLVAEELLASPDPRLSGPEVLATACDAAGTDGTCAQGKVAGCSDPADIPAIAEGLVAKGALLAKADVAGGVRCEADGWRLRGDLDRARQLLTDGIHAAPQNVRLRIVLARQLLGEHQPAQAFELLEKLNEAADPALGRDLRTVRVEALLSSGRTRHAVVEAEQTASAHPNEVWAQRLLAWAFEANGEFPRAIGTLAAAERLAEGPEFDEIHGWRERLESKLTHASPLP